MLSHQLGSTVEISIVDILENFTVAQVNLVYIDRLIVKAGKNLYLRAQLFCGIVEIVVLCVTVKGNVKFLGVFLPLGDFVLRQQGISFLENLLQLKNQRRPAPRSAEKSGECHFL